MCRVAVFGSMKGSNRTVTVGGRGSNTEIKSTINFDWYRTERRESPRSKLGYIDEKKETGTNSVSAEVWRNDNGKVSVDFRTDNFTAGHTSQVEVRVMGIKLQDLMDAYNKQQEVK